MLVICPNCKAEISDDAIFCPKCGQKIACSAEHDEPPAETTSVMPHVPEGQSGEQDMPDAPEMSADAVDETQVFPEEAPQADAAKESKRPRSSKKKVVALVLVGILVAGGAAGGAWYYHEQQIEQQRRQEEERAAALDALRHQDHAVTFTIQADGYTTDDSPIPVEITGTDLDGNAVDTTCYIAQDGTGTTLKSGSYKASVVASPLTKSGTLYAVPDTAISFEIPVPDDESLSADGTSTDTGASDAADADTSDSTDGSASDAGSSDGTIAGGTLQLTQLDPINQTSDIIDAAYQAALAGGFDQATADTYRQTATDAHTAAQKAKEEAEAQAALQKKAQEAHAAYAAFLQGTYHWYTRDVSLDTCKFGPVDIDGDGVDELLVWNPNASHADGYERLFSYQDGQIVELEVGGEACHIFRSGAVLWYHVAQGSWAGRYYTLQNGSLVEVASYVSSDLPASHWKAVATDITDSFKDPGGESMQYCESLKVNGADVDLNTYMATVNKLADEDITPTLVDATAENRSKLLG